MNATDLVDRAALRDDLPDFGPGDTLKVHVRVVEGRASACRCSRASSSAGRAAASARRSPSARCSFGVGVERTFPVHSPIIARIEVVARAMCGERKLYYLRDRVGEVGEDPGEAQLGRC